MSAHDLFAVGVRLIGVGMIVRSAECLTSAFTLYLPSSWDKSNSPQGMMAHAAAYLGLAALFLFGTRQLDRWTYGEDAPLGSRREGRDRDDLA